MPLPIDKLTEVRTLVCHKDCPDGIASALILKNVLPNAEVKFVQYTTKEQIELPAERGMLFCDMSPAPSRLEDFLAVDAIVLDHHKTTKELVKRFGRFGVFADENDEPGVSGAVLAHREVWMPLRDRSNVSNLLVEEFARLAGVRDTWQRQSQDWERACIQAEYLRFFPVDDLLAEGSTFFTLVDTKEQIGRLLLKKRAESVKRTLNESYRFDFVRVESDYAKGSKFTVTIVPTTETSDVADLAETDITIGFRFSAEKKTDPAIEEEPYMEKIHLSLRARGNYDVSAFCKEHGGGGHKNAAGCTVAINPFDAQPYSFIRSLLDTYEEKLFQSMPF